MAVDPSVRIDIAAEFTGKKAFDKAGKSTSSLEKNVKSLAKAFAGVFAVQKVVAFGKASANAFIEDEKAAVRLTNAVKNLGLGFEDARIKNFVTTLEAQSGVLDDKLRPALQALLTTTGSVAKSQELLKLAIDVAAGSGEDLATVANDLSRAYTGNTRGLEKYKLGLTKTELQAASFNTIQTKLNSQFSGANAAYLDTYAGQIGILNVGFANMQETIGKGLLDSFSLLAGDAGIGAATSAMDAFGQSISNALYGAASLVSKLNVKVSSDKFSLGSFLFNAIPVLPALIDYGKTEKAKNTPLFFPTSGGTAAKNLADEKARKAAELAAIKRAKELEALQNKAAKAAKARLEADKKAAAQKAILSKAESIFNIEQIQIEAALKGKISADEKLRLELQRAILNEDYELADQLQKRLEASQRATAALQAQIKDIKPPVDPFAETLKTLESVALLLSKISGMPLTLDPGRKGGGILALEPDDLMPLITAPKAISTPTPTMAEPIPVVVVPSPTPTPSTNNPFAGLGGPSMTNNQPFSVPGYTYQPPSVTVNVTVEGNVLDGDDFTNKVNDALLNANRTGLPRTAAGFLVDAG
jgi:hypothetical protein